MVPSLPLLSCKSSASMKENPVRKKNSGIFHGCRVSGKHRVLNSRKAVKRIKRHFKAFIWTKTDSQIDKPTWNKSMIVTTAGSQSGEPLSVPEENYLRLCTCLENYVWKRWWVWSFIMKIASVKFSSVRGASLYPAFICSHRTICIRVCPVDLVAEQVFVLLVCPGFPPHTLFFRFDQNFFLQIASLFPHTGTPQKWYR